MQPEVYRVLNLVMLGLGSGIIWDTFRAGNRIFSWTKWQRSIADLIFWLSITGILMNYLLSTPEYGWRFYDLSATLLGSVLYFAWFSRWLLPVLFNLVSVLQKLLRLIKQVLDLLFKIISIPLFLLSKIIYGGIHWLLAMLFRPPQAPPPDDDPDAPIIDTQ